MEGKQQGSGSYWQEDLLSKACMSQEPDIGSQQSLRYRWFTGVRTKLYLKHWRTIKRRVELHIQTNSWLIRCDNEQGVTQTQTLNRGGASLEVMLEQARQVCLSWLAPYQRVKFFWVFVLPEELFLTIDLSKIEDGQRLPTRSREKILYARNRLQRQGVAVQHWSWEWLEGAQKNVLLVAIQKIELIPYQQALDTLGWSNYTLVCSQTQETQVNFAVGYEARIDKGRLWRWVGGVVVTLLLVVIVQAIKNDNRPMLSAQMLPESVEITGAESDAKPQISQHTSPEEQVATQGELITEHQAHQTRKFVCQELAFSFQVLGYSEKPTQQVFIRFYDPLNHDALNIVIGVSVQEHVIDRLYMLNPPGVELFLESKQRREQIDWRLQEVNDGIIEWLHTQTGCVVQYTISFI